MNRFIQYIGEKISRRFLMWFSLVLLIPLITLLYFTSQTFQDRERLLARQVQENQLSRALRTEEFYRTMFLNRQREAVSNLFVKMSKDLTPLLERPLDHRKPNDQKVLVKVFSDYFRHTVLPYLGVNIDPDSKDHKEIRAKAPFLVQVMKIGYVGKQLQDTYDTLAESRLNGASLSKYKGKALENMKEVHRLHAHLKVLASLRHQWIPVRSFPNYKDAEQKEYFPDVSQVLSSELFLLFRKLKLLEPFYGMEKIENENLEELRKLTVRIMKNRFEILDQSIRIQRSYYAVKNSLDKYSFRIREILEMDVEAELPLHSVYSMKSILNDLLQRLRSGKVKRGDLVLLTPVFEKLLHRTEEIVNRTWELLGMVMARFLGESPSKFEENRLKEVLVNLGMTENDKKDVFQYLQALIKKEGIEKLDLENPELLASYFIIKLFNHGLQGDEWMNFQLSLDIYKFPVRRLIELKNMLDKLDIKPRDEKAMGYFMLDRWIYIEDLEETDWHLFARLIMHLIRFSFMGDIALNNANDAYVSALVSGADLASTRGNSISLSAGERTIDLIWDVIPKHFQTADFRVGHSPLPLGLNLALLNNTSLSDQYFRLSHVKPQAKNEIELKEWLKKNLNQAYLNEFPESLKDKRPGIGYGSAARMIKEVLEQFFIFKDSLDLGEENFEIGLVDFVASYLGLYPDYRNQRNNWWLKSTQLQLLGVDQELRSHEYHPHHMLNTVMKETLDPNSETYSKFQAWLQDRTSPFFFSYIDKKGKERIGSIVSSKSLKNYVFYLTMDSDVAYRENSYLALLLALICALSLFFGARLGKTLAQKIVTPVNELSTNVTAFSEGDMEARVDVARTDEIGMMAHYFNVMVDNIDQKMMEMSALNSLNQLLLEGKELQFLMDHAIKEFSVATGARFGYLGFFEQASREKFIAGAIFCVDELGEVESEQLVSALKELVSKSENADEFWFLPPDQCQFYSSKTALIHSISPKSEPLQDVSEVLEEMEGQRSKKGSQQVQTDGFLILLDYDEVLLDEERKAFIRSLGSQAGTVILKAYLDKVKKDNEEGQNIQEGLMPDAAPESFGAFEASFSFVAAKYLGGDFFDFVEFENPHHVGVLISDVSGKGIGPSLFGTTCKAYLKMLGRDAKKTADTLEDMNNRLCHNKDNPLFASAFYLTIDLETLMMTYSSAGHNKMIIYRKADHSIEYLSAKGLVLGMFTPAIYEQKETQLYEGDWVILYTDGVNELENPKLELYGMERFEDFILTYVSKSPEEFKDALIKDLEVYREGVAPSDDITFIAMKMNQPVQVESSTGKDTEEPDSATGNTA